ncbi:divalent-cation tolerance protein CutA [Plantactinospora mayteni]|uniref:Divalent-cation tolerance protein CutA n=1 Tax=Plantactinospora mayteni TaxID=566021 RepID=A0ABQ4ESE9_9ACTN|nr:divalent-cation tolerance protein CutA [Plantactinospora mayteni]
MHIVAAAIQRRVPGVDQICIVTTVVDARAVADVLAAAAVAGRLAACAQVTGPVDSTYWWESRMETTREWTVVFKTAPDRVEALVDQVRAAHPYEVPEVLVTWVEGGNPEYSTWLHGQTRP